MSFRVPNNQSVSWSVYFQAVCNESGLNYDFIRSRTARIMQAFDCGEPIWAIVMELKMIYDITKDYRPTKTPLQLAARVVKS